MPRQCSFAHESAVRLRQGQIQGRGEQRHVLAVDRPGRRGLVERELELGRATPNGVPGDRPNGTEAAHRVGDHDVVEALLHAFAPRR